MTSKQAQKEWRKKQANGAPRMSKAEYRRWELAEQERIRRELDHEKSLNKARSAREKKKAKEEEVKLDRKRKGLAPVRVRPSQDTLGGFIRVQKPSRSTRALEAIEEETEEASAADMGSDKENHSPPRPSKRQKLFHSPNKIERPDEDLDVDSPSVAKLLNQQLISEAATAIETARRAGELAQKKHTCPTRSSLAKDVDVEGSELLIAASPRYRNAASKVHGTTVESISARTRLHAAMQDKAEHSKACGTKQPARGAKTDSCVKDLDPHPTANPPSSTQIFLWEHFDDFFPTASQEARELEEASQPRHLSPLSVVSELGPEEKASVAASPAAFSPTLNPIADEISFISTQDLAMSSQDFLDIDDTPQKQQKPSQPVRKSPTYLPSGHSRVARSTPPTRLDCSGHEKAMLSPSRQTRTGTLASSKPRPPTQPSPKAQAQDADNAKNSPVVPAKARPPRRRFFSSSAQEETQVLTAMYRSRETARREERDRRQAEREAFRSAMELKQRRMEEQEEELARREAAKVQHARVQLKDTSQNKLGSGEQLIRKAGVASEQLTSAALSAREPNDEPAGSQETDYGSLDWNEDLEALEMKLAAKR